MIKGERPLGKVKIYEIDSSSVINTIFIVRIGVIKSVISNIDQIL